MPRWTLAALPAALLVGLLALADDPPRAGRKVALLVAVQDYTGTGLSNLKYCENDVAALAEVLRGQGYKDQDVVLLTTAAAFEKKKENLFPTAANVRSWLFGLAEDLRPEDTLLVAFSGHGVHLKALKEKGLHFCAKGTDLDKPETMVSLAAVYDTLEKDCKAGVKVLVVDACRNDPADGKAAGDGRMESLTRPLVPDPPGGVAAFFSCSTGQQSFESDALKRGVFMHHFVEGLKGGPADAPTARDGEVTVPLLEDYLMRAVPVFVKRDRGDPRLRQVPERRGSLRGSVALARVAVAAVERPPAGGGKPPDTYVSKATGMKFVRIPKGSFKMGADDAEADSDEQPVHEVTISTDFYLGVTEVTQKQYAAVTGKNPSEFKGDDLPVESVSWDEAVAFAEALSAKDGVTYRLPTEAEWEYACRAGSASRYHFGDGTADLGDYAWYSEKAGDKTHPVGGKKPNPFGLYDMHGNVWEWCADWHGDYPEGRVTDPTGPAKGSDRVYRGGGWYFPAGYCRSANRFRFAPSFRSSNLGFRLALVPPSGR